MKFNQAVRNMLVLLGVSLLVVGCGKEQVAKENEAAANVTSTDTTSAIRDTASSETDGNIATPTTSPEGIALPDFTAQDRDGNSVSLSDFRGKVVVINFWTTWCGYCKQEMPDMVEVDKYYQMDEDVAFLTVNLTTFSETKEKAITFLDENGYEFQTIFDESGEIAQIFGIDSIPVTVVIGKEGNWITGVKGMTNKETVIEMAEAYR